MMYVITTDMGDSAYGPFDSREEAEAYAHEHMGCDLDELEAEGDAVFTELTLAENTQVIFR
jgi:hypothetical protein